MSGWRREKETRKKKRQNSLIPGVGHDGFSPPSFKYCKHVRYIYGSSPLYVGLWYVSFESCLFMLPPLLCLTTPLPPPSPWAVGMVDPAPPPLLQATWALPTLALSPLYHRSTAAGRMFCSHSWEAYSSLPRRGKESTWMITSRAASTSSISACSCAVGWRFSRRSWASTLSASTALASVWVIRCTRSVGSAETKMSSLSCARTAVSVVISRATSEVSWSPGRA
mmetsp:Transcript_12327/g.20057  ORF Transcript_12327/g.20057 Transcript_12327/m.20057 type:complete len:224 (+) Transcript_12327:308-979(+)